MLIEKKGVSLIVLIITVIIIIILASIIVVTLNTNNPISSAREAKFKSDLSGFRDELMATHSNNEIENLEYVREDVYVSPNSPNKYQEMKKYIPSITEEYSKKLFIDKGKLKIFYGFKDQKEMEDGNSVASKNRKWAEEIGIEAVYALYGDADGNGFLSSVDIITFTRLLENVNTIDEERKLALDLDFNGVIDENDLALLRKLIE